MPVTPTKRTGTIQTDFRGLIQLLAKNLYPQEDMFIRELIQNAHDSIVARQARGNAPAGVIEIVADRAAATVVFRDNGVGMTEREIVDYLGTIGRSGTGELRAQLKERDRARAQALIGQFGIGFLSAFVAAGRLVVETRSAADGQASLRWSSGGGPDYELTDVEKAEPGTDVTLHIKPDYIGITNPESLRKAVRKYADFIPFPISINGQGPVNSMQAPWHRSYGSDADRAESYAKWVGERFPDMALEVIPVDIETPYPIKGVLYISDRHLPDVDMPGIVDIYQARMFIKEGDREILPPWAKFVRGVIDSPALTPTAARDAVQQDRAHNEIQAVLGRLIIDTLQQMARNEPARFRRLMEWHHYGIKGMAIEFDDFFHAVADTVIFETNIPEGHSFRTLTIPEYCKLQTETDDKGRKVIYYISEQGAAPQFYRLCAAKKLLAINAGRIFDESFLKKYAAHRPDEIVLHNVDIAGGTAIFQPLSDEERLKFVDAEFRLRVLLRHNLPDQETLVQTERFAPPEIPAVLTQSQDVDIARRLEQLTGPLGMLSSGLGEIVSEALGIQKLHMRPIVFHLNSTSPLIQRLLREDFNDAVIQDAWLTIYNNAFMYSRHVLSAQNLEVLHGQTLRALDKVLELREQQRQSAVRISQLEKTTSPERAARRHPYISLFVMMPFGDEYKIVERALRDIFENDPYGFQVILARDRTMHQNLFENVKAHMRLVSGFIADISDLNPNVMLELGITEVDSEARPVIVLHRSGSPDPPVDLRGRLYVEYNSPTTPGGGAREIASQLRSKFKTIDALEQLLASRTARYLSLTYLHQKLPRLQLSSEEMERLCKAFPTVEELVRSKAGEIEKRATLDHTTAKIIEVMTREL
jgi:molecular chaperone HtpG